ncbi:MAG: BrnA antitoxin family protein [Minisyncoccales bacterium]|jgi:predicted DNA binding CopG/RHH family protein|nr:BrnA antitoxin family protein [Candidatus Pacearchaeota archaeon]
MSDKSKKLKTVPQFKTQDEEREFWAKNDSADYIDWSDAKTDIQFPNLKFSTRAISIRLPENMIVKLKEIANKRDVPYQSLVKMILADKIKDEMSAK